MLVDGTKKFSCRHEFIAMPFGFVCSKCEHERPEFELDNKKALIFFPSQTEKAEILDPITLPVPRNR